MHAESRRERTAKGTVVNGAFQVGLGLLNMLKAVIAAAFLTPAEFGVWGVILIVAMTLISLKYVGIADKYIQQEEGDQELAFQKAFTLDLLASCCLMLLMGVAVPILASAYGQPDLLAPGLVLALMLPAIALQAPAWVYYRRLDYLRQRIFETVDPLIGFVVTVALAVAGLGYWSLVIGMVAGAVSGAAVCIAASPYPIRLRIDAETVRSYFSFSWPLFLAALSTAAMAQIAILAGDARLGLAGAGAITLAASFSAYADRVDGIITQTMYPAICRVRDRADLLIEAFIKSNRLTLMWGMPFGVGLALFAQDLVTFAIGDRWQAAVFLIQVFGIAVAFHHIGFNWDSFYRAHGETRPIAAATAMTLGAFCLTALPLMFWKGLDGFAVGMALTTAATLAVRWHYLRLFFPNFRMLRHTFRAIAPTIPAVAAVLVARFATGGDGDLAAALGELALYVLVTIGATLYLEASLLSEVRGYLRRRPTGETEPIAAPVQIPLGAALDQID